MAKDCGGYIFGTERVSGMIVTSANLEATPQFSAQAKDDTGETIALSVGKATGTATVSGYMSKSVNPPDINTSFDLDGRKFWCDRVKLSKSSEDFQKIEISGRFWEDVDSSC